MTIASTMLPPRAAAASEQQQPVDNELSSLLVEGPTPGQDSPVLLLSEDFAVETEESNDEAMESKKDA